MNLLHYYRGRSFKISQANRARFDHTRLKRNQRIQVQVYKRPENRWQMLEIAQAVDTHDAASFLEHHSPRSAYRAK